MSLDESPFHSSHFKVSVGAAIYMPMNKYVTR